MTTTTKAKDERASKRSVGYLTDLVRDRESSPGLTREESLARLARRLLAGRTQREVSREIDRVIKLPARKEAAAAPARAPEVPDSIPDSKFALLTELLVDIPDPWRRQELIFFEVKQFRGRRVIRRLVGAPGRFNRGPVPAALALELFGHLEDPAFAFQAAKTFGAHYSVCGRCGAELTDDQSRERQFGPICWELMEPWRKGAGVL